MKSTQGKSKNENRIVICHAYRKKDGKRCTRLALKGEEYCWQHSSSFWRRLRNSFMRIGGLVGIVTITSLVLNLFSITDRVFPKAAPSSTIAPTPLPRADKLYFTFLVDASSRMSEIFDGNKTKWDSVREAALENLLFGLPARANFGLIMLGGSTTGATCDSMVMSEPFGSDNRKKVGDIIGNQQIAGAAPLAKAIDLARDQLLELADDSTVKGLELFVFLGGGDTCSNNDLKPILLFLQNSAKYLTNTHIDIFILSREITDQDILKAIEQTNQEIQNVKVNIIESAGELATEVDQSFEQAKERAREIEPSAVAAQETIVVQQLSSTDTIENTIRPNGTTPSQIANTVAPTITVTYSPSPTVTASVTPSPIPTPIPPTQIPPTEIPPTAIPPTPIPPSNTPMPVVQIQFNGYIPINQDGCDAEFIVYVSGGSVTGSFHVWNAFYPPTGDVYPPITLAMAQENKRVGLGGDLPDYHVHEVWFEYNGVSSNRVTDLICPHNQTP